MKKDALIAALMLASAAPAVAAPGLILADVTPNVVNVGDSLTVTMRITGYSDTIEIDGFAFDVLYPPGMFTFVAGSFDLGDAAGPDQQWLSKPNQETVADGYSLTSFNDGSTPGVANIEMADLGPSSPERGTLTASGFMVSFKLTAVGEGSGQICGRAVPGPNGPEVLYDTNLRRAGVPQFLCSNVVVRSTCTNPPSITCPSNIVVWTCSNSMTVSYKADATSDCCSNVIVTCSPPSGSSFPAGTVTPVTCTARDTCGNQSSSCTFTVTVRPDTAPPVIHCPTGVIVRWLCTNRTTLDYVVTATDDCDTNVTIECNPPPGTLVPVPGTYGINCTATDDCGKRDFCQFAIRLIHDTTPPVLNCPTNPVVVWTCTNSYVLDYTVTATDDCDPNVEIVCNPPRGTIVPAPSNLTVSCTARDDCGNIDGCQFQVRVIRDTQPPIINCPGDMVVWGCSNRVPVFYDVGVQDDCDRDVDVRCTLPDGTSVPPGTALPPGNYVITCTARDDCDHTSSCSFTVKVIQDTEPPQIHCPSNIVTWTCSPTGGGTPVTYTVTATDDCDPMPEVRCVPPSGSPFPPGTTTVNCEAIDDCNHRSTCSFTVTVRPDTAPPVIHCPSNTITLWVCTNRAVLDYTVTATDDCDTNVQIFCDPPPGTVVPAPGIYTVTCTAFDDCQKTDRCEFTIRVIRDTTAPVINCPSNIVQWLCTNRAPLNYTVTATDDCDPDVRIVCNPPPGTVVPVPGIYNISCFAEDDCGNRSGCQFSIRLIEDTQPPTIVCPSNIVVFTCRDCYPVIYRVEARDDCDTNVTIVCNPPSGTCFPLGTNEVRCVATDDCGNRDECKFQVIVLREQGPRLTIRRAAAFDGFIICWPAPSTGWRLQCTRSLNPPIVWEDVTTAPVLMGSQWCVTLPNIPRHRFYRLCKPCDPVITGVRPLNPRPNDILFIDGSGFGNDPDDLCVAIALGPGVGPALADEGTAPSSHMDRVLLPLRALFADDKFLTARMPSALPPEPGMMGHIMVAHGMGNVGRFRPAFFDVFVADDVWVWEKTGPDGMGEDPVQPQPEPPPPNECWFFSGEPVDCQLCVFLEPNCPWPSNAIVSISARAHDSVTGAGGYDLDCPTIRFITSGGTVLDCAERIADVIRCAFQQQAGVTVDVRVDLLPDGRVKITVRIPNGCIDRGFLQICVRSGNDPVITGVEPSTGKQGDMIMIRGANFGNNPDNLCVVMMEAGPAGDAEGGIAAGTRYIPLQAVEAMGDHILARLGPVPPNARPGPIMVGLGQGSMARFRPAFFDIFVADDVWTWRMNGQGKGMSTTPFNPTPDPPPPPSNCWFYSEAPVDGKLCIFLTPDCPWPSNAYVTVIARAHDATTGTGADLSGPNVRFLGGGSLVECAERIKDILRCAFLQQSGVIVDVFCELLADGRVKITVAIPGGHITHGGLTICVGPTPNSPTSGP